MTLHDVIHKALVTALAKHGQSQYGVMAEFDPNATETKITGFYKLRFVSEDITKAVQAEIAAAVAVIADAAAPAEVSS
jgi:hypothetical protein